MTVIKQSKMKKTAQLLWRDSLTDYLNKIFKSFVRSKLKKMDMQGYLQLHDQIYRAFILVQIKYKYFKHIKYDTLNEKEKL